MCAEVLYSVFVAHGNELLRNMKVMFRFMLSPSISFEHLSNCRSHEIVSLATNRNECQETLLHVTPALLFRGGILAISGCMSLASLWLPTQQPPGVLLVYIVPAL